MTQSDQTSRGFRRQSKWWHSRGISWPSSGLRGYPGEVLATYQLLVFPRRLQLRGPDASGIKPLRAGPCWEKWLKPHHTMLTFPLCSQVTILPTPPPLVLQASSGLSSKFRSQCPPKDVAAQVDAPSQRRALEKPVQLFPGGHLLQGAELTTRNIPETSLEWVVTLVDHLAALKVLPNVSQWVLQTREGGYRIQFGSYLILPTVVGPEQVLVR